MYSPSGACVTELSRIFFARPCISNFGEYTSNSLNLALLLLPNLVGLPHSFSVHVSFARWMGNQRNMPTNCDITGIPSAVVKSEDTLYPVCSWGTPGPGRLHDEVLLRRSLARTVHASAGH